MSIDKRSYSPLSTNMISVTNYNICFSLKTILQEQGP